MTRRPCTFKRRDLRAVLKEAAAAAAAGLPVASVRVNSQGEIEIVLGKTGAQELTGNEWDDELLHGTHQTQTH